MKFHVKCGKHTLREEAMLLARLLGAPRAEEHESLHVAGGEYFILRGGEYDFRVFLEDALGLGEYQFEIAIEPKRDTPRTLTEDEELLFARLLRSSHQRVIRELRATRRRVEVIVYRKRAGVLVAVRDTTEL